MEIQVGGIGGIVDYGGDIDVTPRAGIHLQQFDILPISVKQLVTCKETKDITVKMIHQ